MKLPDNVRAAAVAAATAMATLLLLLAGWLGGGDDTPPTSTTFTPPTLTSLPPVTTHHPTTVPPTTTTAAPTTTTEAPPTTTQPPTTTTTTHHPPGPPPVIECPGTGTDRPFTFRVGDLDRGIRWTELEYCRSLPYENGRYEWIAGDRAGYGCAYTFISDLGHPVRPGEIQIRTTVVRTSEGPYTGISDKLMSEGQHTWAGIRALIESRELGDCPTSSLKDYSADACIAGPPILALWHDHHLVDVRDFQHQPAHDTVRFCLLENQTEPQTVQGAGLKAAEGGATCPNMDKPGWGCEPHVVLQRVVVGVVVEIDGQEVIPAVDYYDVLVPESRVEIHVKG